HTHTHTHRFSLNSYHQVQANMQREMRVSVVEAPLLARIHTHSHTHTRTHTHTHTHKHACTHTHTCMHTQTWHSTYYRLEALPPAHENVIRKQLGWDFTQTHT